MFRSDSTTTGNVVRRFPPDGGGPSAPPLEATLPRLSLGQRIIKRAIDIVGALVFFTLFGPLYLMVALGVLISMGRPVHFWQTRLGERGQRFRFYKFRSMVRNSDHVLDEFLSRSDMARTEWDTFQKLEKDPRITPIGAVIRKLSLDELPQFWNVLKGDMSLVGPRPCMERQRSLYGRGWTHYCAMRPGITGLWQVSGRNRLSYARRVELDVEYVTNWSLWLDIKILFRTVRAVVSGEGSR
ncbi:sugar transferase [Variovorax ginsengisoli]|uniref:Sugar transferase n=1 Tax=Variovorax ginsengisoli TaxID=363844 RepID=A0ABT8RY82_9BURK|nr:sugar transferase [Variovorax ginsengisoli]MDN8612455.1 sugar transferase [Variovorax ginsengisoli]MDO1531625.1 sugar transferase [Variovorax ginsengisoli]